MIKVQLTAPYILRQGDVLIMRLQFSSEVLYC